METLEGISLDIYSENISEHIKTTSGGVRIEASDTYEKFVFRLSKREVKELIKILKEKA